MWPPPGLRDHRDSSFQLPRSCLGQIIMEQADKFSPGLTLLILFIEPSRAVLFSFVVHFKFALSNSLISAIFFFFCSVFLFHQK